MVCRFGSDKGREIQLLDLLPRPGCLAQEFEAGLHRGIALEAVDIDPAGKGVPAVVLDESCDDLFEGDAMEWVVDLFVMHDLGGKSLETSCRKTGQSFQNVLYDTVHIDWIVSCTELFG